MIKNAVIFAGGKSSRMGKDKSLLPFKNAESLSEFQYRRLQKLFKRVYISAKEDKFDFDVALIKDIDTTHSPLIGIISIFERLDADAVFVLSVDTPFVDEGIIKNILLEEQNSKEKDAIIAITPDGSQPLCGIYRRSILPLAKKLLKEDIHKLNHLLRLGSTKEVFFKQKEKFLNINTPKEYEDALNR